jgi:hypothetical protein
MKLAFCSRRTISWNLRENLGTSTVSGLPYMHFIDLTREQFPSYPTPQHPNSKVICIRYRYVATKNIP